MAFVSTANQRMPWAADGVRVATSLRCWKQRHSQRWGIREMRGRAGGLIDCVGIFEACSFQGLVAVGMVDKDIVFALTLT